MPLPRLLAVLASTLFAMASPRGQSPEALATCSLCTDATIACPTCNGDGTQQVDCLSCGGDGTRECARCVKQPGSIDCPNPVCRGGQTTWDTGVKDPCKLCKAKGTLPCPECRGKKAERGNCARCAGTGKHASTCPTCIGGKRVACPLCKPPVAAPKCLACDDTGRAACRLCRKDDNGTHPCVRCNATGKIACAKCAGLDRVPCTKCGASGKTRLGERDRLLPMPPKKAGVRECDLCSGVAVKNCGDCKGGRGDCPACVDGKAPGTCAACTFGGWLPCDDCISGGYATVAVLATFLVEKGFPEQAMPLFERAIETAQQMKRPRGEIAAKLEELAKLRRQAQQLENLANALGQRPVVPDAVQKPAEWVPAESLERHWPDPRPGQELTPWLDDEWMIAHRQRTAQRLRQGLERARAAAAKAGK